MLACRLQTVQLPPLTDLLALLGIDLVLCAACLRLLEGRSGVSPWAKWVTALCFVVLWLPVGPARLPLLAYVRGISSDLSITSVALACAGSGRRLLAMPPVARLEKLALYGVISLAALFLYPSALGWGDWDGYRSGWGSWGMWATLLFLSLFSWVNGLRLLPLLIALSLLAWSAALMESGNLWDYLIDPWLAGVALFQCLNSGAQRVVSRFRRSGPSVRRGH